MQDDDMTISFLQRNGGMIATSLIGSSFAGIAAMLSDGKPVQFRMIARAAFVSAVVGGIFLAALWDSLAKTRPGWLIAVCLCAGAGGGNMLDALARAAKKLLLSRFTKEGEDK